MIELDFYAKKLLTFGSSWWFFYSFQNDRLERKKRSEILSENSAVVRVTNVLTKTLQAPGKFGLFLELLFSLQSWTPFDHNKIFCPKSWFDSKGWQKEWWTEGECVLNAESVQPLNRPLVSVKRPLRFSTTEFNSSTLWPKSKLNPLSPAIVGILSHILVLVPV